MEQQLFTVFGATGQQGGALLQYLFNHPRLSKIYRLRGVTRDSKKPAARALVEQGVEMVEADMNDPASLEAATQGSHIVFAMTDFWSAGSKETEIAQGKALANAALATKAHALIWSSLPRIGLPNFDGKADVEAYIRNLPMKSLFYMPGWFMQNQLSFSKPVKQANENQQGGETYILKPLFPGCEADTLVPLVDNEDIGKYLQPFLDDQDRYNGVGLVASSEFMTPRDMCAVWRKVTGKEVWFENEEEVKRIDRGGEDSWYYGDGSRKALEWTLEQMEGKTTSWEDFVKREEGAWF
ncbi:unnamed protein product [Periconia digitata]|uniref:NmrA-like domain-containing protein n=1 Tax=Periconia digitata TaxID=1303443 RepID=A0A9W4XF90_9PLEO|nr:unnamed protein product [Periconia digitata]